MVHHQRREAGYIALIVLTQKQRNIGAACYTFCFATQCIVRSTQCVVSSAQPVVRSAVLLILACLFCSYATGAVLETINRLCCFTFKLNSNFNFLCEGVNTGQASHTISFQFLMLQQHYYLFLRLTLQKQRSRTRYFVYTLYYGNTALAEALLSVRRLQCVKHQLLLAGGRSRLVLTRSLYLGAKIKQIFNYYYLQLIFKQLDN